MNVGVGSFSSELKAFLLRGGCVPMCLIFSCFLIWIIIFTAMHMQYIMEICKMCVNKIITPNTLKICLHTFFCKMACLLSNQGSSINEEFHGWLLEKKMKMFALKQFYANNHAINVCVSWALPAHCAVIHIINMGVHLLQLPVVDSQSVHVLSMHQMWKYELQL